MVNYIFKLQNQKQNAWFPLISYKGELKIGPTRRKTETGEAKNYLEAEPRTRIKR